jgi:hypothetical protein
MWAFMQAFAIIPPQPRSLVTLVARALPDERVKAIAECKGRESSRTCAKRYGIAHTTVIRIWNGELHAAPRRANWIRISDDTVEEIRVRHEEAGWSYDQLSKFYGLPKATIQALCKYRRR